MGLICSCVSKHSPANPPIENHHSPPTSYTLLPGGKRIIIPLCANAHGIQHRLLNEYRAAKGPPKTLYRYSRFHQDIAKYAWSQTDKNAPIPRTISTPGNIPPSTGLVMNSPETD